MNDLFLGFSQSKPSDSSEQVWLNSEERRRTHALIVGSPGSGKSKFLEWMIRGDIRNGQGICLIDPHGELYDNILQWCGYRNFLTKQIVLVDPSRGEHITGFNPFRPKSGMSIDVQVNGMVDALVRVWGAEDTNQTPTLDRVLRLLFSAMVSCSLSLHEAHQLVDFSARRFRKEVIESITDPTVRAAWADLHGLSRKEFHDEVLSTKNRLFKLVTSAAVRRFMGVTAEGFNIDLARLMDEGAIVLVNLQESGTLDKDAAKAFGALLLNDLFASAKVYRGKATTGVEPKPFYVYVDEWQTIASQDIKSILAQARKFGLNLVLANQDPAQIVEAFSEPFLDTVMTCCKIKACFGGLGERSGQRMTREMLLGQIDLNEEKYVIESTKFWPRYTRDVVRTTSRSRSGGRGRSAGSSFSTGWGESVGASLGRGSAFDLEGDMTATSLSGAETAGWSRSGASGASESKSETEGWSEGEATADIPILIPEPFTEVTSRTVYSLEEQLAKWTAELVNQYERHCFVKLPGTPTMPLLVPLVPDFHVREDVVSEYETELAELTGARTPTEVDEMLEKQAGSRIRAAAEKSRADDAAPDEEFFE